VPEISLTVNGIRRTDRPNAGDVLLTGLRRLGHTEVRAGCRTGDCGTCAVLLDGVEAPSCLVPLAECEGAAVATATSEHPGIAAARDAIQRNRAFQCGFCTPGFVVALGGQDAGLLQPGGLRGHLCRCTGYRGLLQAAHELAGETPVDEVTAGLADPAAARVVRGAEPFTLDLTIEDMGVLAFVQSPHASAVVRSIDTAVALAEPGVRAVLTPFNTPATRFSSARNTDREINPDDQRVLDTTVRYVGQRVAVVVADDGATARRAAELVEIDYAVRPAVLTVAAALEPAAPKVHGDKVGIPPEDLRIDRLESNIAVEQSVTHGDPASGHQRADAVVTGVWRTPRMQHVHLEPHSAAAWFDDDGSITIRSATQVPHLTRNELCRIFDLPSDRLRVQTARVGGGFGAKQELIVEDVLLAALLATGRPACVELTREQQFTLAPTRHASEVRVTIGATADGTFTVMELDYLLDAGAHGNHSRPVLRHGLSSGFGPYRCPDRRMTGRAVYTNQVPGGAFRGYGLGQVVHAVERAVDGLAAELEIDPVRLRRINLLRPGESPLGLTVGGPLEAANYGLPGCLEQAVAELATTRGRDTARNLCAEYPLLGGGPADWALGEGVAVGATATIPARGHRAEARMTLCDGRFELRVGGVEFGSGVTALLQGLTADELGVPADLVDVRLGDTALVGQDSGTFGSTSVMVAGQAVTRAGKAMLAALAADPDVSPEVMGVAWEVPSSTVGNVQAFRVAAHRITGVVVILDSIHAADAGTVLNEAQARGQVEGAVAQGIGAALSEMVVIDDGRVANASLRAYRIPQAGRFPATRVFFADTYDPHGPRGAKSMSEAAINPVAPALANAIRDAVGDCPHDLPLTPDRVWEQLWGDGAAAPGDTGRQDCQHE
jgi:CO/xanthine dehydrogenase Mo-binding subunit/aerobic-type carbon monoxide dehydrogenase small subunit (CoxS/CutS family)